MEATAAEQQAELEGVRDELRLERDILSAVRQQVEASAAARAATLPFLPPPPNLRRFRAASPASSRGRTSSRRRS